MINFQSISIMDNSFCARQQYSNAKTDYDFDYEMISDVKINNHQFKKTFSSSYQKKIPGTFILRRPKIPHFPRADKLGFLWCPLNN